jgi:hypothetical protein
VWTKNSSFFELFLRYCSWINITTERIFASSTAELGGFSRIGPYNLAFMKKLYTVCCILLATFLFSPALWGQSGPPRSYVIAHTPLASGDLSLLENALDAAQLNKYRQLHERSKLYFEDGTEVELLSAQEMQALGLPVNLAELSSGPPSAQSHSVFAVHPSGILLEKASVPEWIVLKSAR